MRVRPRRELIMEDTRILWEIRDAHYRPLDDLQWGSSQAEIGLEAITPNSFLDLSKRLGRGGDLILELVGLANAWHRWVWKF